MKGIKDYERPSVAVDAVVFGISTVPNSNPRLLDEKRLEVLLIKRGEEPFKDKYALPGGFLRPDESLEEAACRELEEETGLTEISLLGLGNYSSPDRDPRGWIISCAYLALTNVNTYTLSTSPDSDASEAKWFSLSYNADDGGITLENGAEKLVVGGPDGTDRLAFDHGRIICDAYKKLQDEVVNHHLIFKLLPEFFTISELQVPYELITGRHEASANFRRKLADIIEETDRYSESNSAHRASKLYTRRKTI
ncbi:MAG: NUDIX hydrolase [Oscillospiraceae bacterium]|nr:NUDIX hydrolase [Oscillospiraceae bacterium]